MTYQFNRTPSRGCRYSVFAERFITEYGCAPALQWFKTMEEAQNAVDLMLADGRFYGISSYVRSQETADAAPFLRPLHTTAIT